MVTSEPLSEPPHAGHASSARETASPKAPIALDRKSVLPHHTPPLLAPIPKPPIADSPRHRFRRRLEARKSRYPALQELPSHLRHDIFDVPRMADSDERLGRAALVTGKRVHHLLQHGRVVSQPARDEAGAHF